MRDNIHPYSITIFLQSPASPYNKVKRANKVRPWGNNLFSLTELHFRRRSNPI